MFVIHWHLSRRLLRHRLYYARNPENGDRSLGLIEFVVACNFASSTAIIVGAPLASAVKAEDTTVIRKDEPERDTTVIKKKEDVNVLPIPHREEKTIIKKDSD